MVRKKQWRKSGAHGCSGCPAIPVQVVLVLLVKSPYPKVFLMAAIMEATLRSVMT